MRVVNAGIFLILFGILFIWLLNIKLSKNTEFVNLIKKYKYVLAIMFIANSISLALTFQNDFTNIILSRDSISGSEREVNLVLQKGEDQLFLDLELQRQQLSSIQVQKMMDEAFSELEKNMLDENQKMSRITSNLKFEIDYKKYPFEVEVMPDDYLIMNEDGVIRNERSSLLESGYTKNALENGIRTGFEVCLSYNEEIMQRHYDITVFPKTQTKNEKLLQKVVEKIKKDETELSGEKEFYIPSVLYGVTISMKRSIAKNPLFVLFVGVVLSGLLPLREMELNRKRKRQREDSLRRSYPRFVNEMVLLLGAGMQVRHILDVLINEYEKDKEQFFIISKSKHFCDEREPLITELRVAKQNLEMGMAEEKVYYQLGRRLKLGCYIKLMSLLEQNVKKGAKGLAYYFEQEERNALEERKNLAKRYGEEAGTKLLGPMMLQLLVVMLIIMVPALMSF